jgi:hypothetical protein
MNEEPGLTDTIVVPLRLGQKTLDSREERISKGEKVEVLYVPGEGLKVTLGDETLTTARELHIVATAHGCEVRIRLHKHENAEEHKGVGVWTDYMIVNPTVYAVVKRSPVEESDASTV